MSDANLAGLSILVVEDESLLRKQLVAELERLRADVASAQSLAAARQALGEQGFDFVLLDVNLPDGSGMDLLKTLAPGIGSIIMTAHGAVEGAVEAMRLGALDYLVKPFDPGELVLVIARARKARQSARLDEHRRSNTDSGGFYFGDSLQELEKQLAKIVAADERIKTHLSPVLIQGETGTGKTTIARWIHHRGPRSGQPLVEMNCSAVAETLAESELFGHERGAFTDARSARMGLFEAANGGTLFLDELPSLSVGLQAKLLKALEDHRIRRVGGTREIALDVRVIAASNRSLSQLASSGQFREDLFHRLDLYRVQLPPLRERGDDIMAIAELLIERLCRRHRLPGKKVTRLGRERLMAYHWPGNVRELAHELERAIVFEENAELEFDQLQIPSGAVAAAKGSDWLNPGFKFPQEGFMLEEAISRLIHDALVQTSNNVSAAARLLGVSRDYLRYRLSGQKADGLADSPQQTEDGCP